MFKTEFNNNRENISLPTQNEHTSVPLHPRPRPPPRQTNPQLRSQGSYSETVRNKDDHPSNINTVLTSFMTDFNTMFNQLLEHNGLILALLSQVINNLTRNG